MNIVITNKYEVFKSNHRSLFLYRDMVRYYFNNIDINTSICPRIAILLWYYKKIGVTLK